jgi:A/G-specific adenine glycosylase
MHPLSWRGVALRPRIGDEENLRWVTREGYASLGMPAPVRGLLEVPAAG